MEKEYTQRKQYLDNLTSFNSKRPAPFGFPLPKGVTAISMLFPAIEKAYPCKNTDKPHG